MWTRGLRQTYGGRTPLALPSPRTASPREPPHVTLATFPVGLNLRRVTFVIPGESPAMSKCGRGCGI